MHICVIGTGYVGLVTGACLAEMGNVVTCVDSNPSKISELQRGVITIYEPGLEPLVRRNVAEDRLFFTTDLAEAVRQARALFITVGTPPDQDNVVDITHVMNVARELSRHIAKHTLVVVKSTVPVGTTERIEAIIRKGLEKRGISPDLDRSEERRVGKECRL